MHSLGVGVVIPAYQAEETLAEAIASVLAQTEPVQQIVVVDDGSTDGTAEVARSFGPPVEVVVMETGGGPSRARNRGLERLSTPWAAFLDADDCWHPQKLADQLAVVRARPDAVLVASDWVRRQPNFPPKPVRVPLTEWSFRDILRLNRFQTSTVLLRRDVALALGGFNPRLDGVEDWDLWLRAATRGAVLALRWPYVMYRDLPTGYSKDMERVYRTMWLMLEREACRGTVSPSVAAWHQLRFAVAFWLAGDRTRAEAIWRQLRHDDPGGVGTVAASVRWLIPFLARRAWRRWVAR